MYGQGISRAGDVLDLASEAGIIEKSGAWSSYGNERIGQGRDNVKTYLEQHPQLLDKLEAQILAKHNIRRGAQASAPAPEASAKEPAAAKNGARPEEGKKVPHIPVKPAN